MRAFIFIPILCSMAAAVPATSHAAPPAAEADALIARGLELRRQGKTAEALVLFQQAHAIAPMPRTSGQMGLAEASLEHWLDAETHLWGALAAADDPWVRKNRTFLDQAMTLAKSHIGELVITGPPGTSVSVEGKPIGTLPAIAARRIAAGNVVVTATGPGFKEFSKSVTVTGGASTSLAIVLEPVENRPAVAIAPPVPVVTAPPPAPVVEPVRHWKTWTGASLAAAGAGLLAWGIVWVAVDGNDACGSLTGPGCGNVYDTKTPGWILAAGGAAAITGGTILLLTDRRASSEVRVGFSPTSVLVQGRF